MPTSAQQEDVLSKQIAWARLSLLETLQNQLDSSLASYLKPQENGVPFIDVEKEPPQIAAIQKVINALFYAEEALNIWENMDSSTTWGKIKAVPQGIEALRKLYTSLASLNDATPEIQAIIMNNYYLLEPVFNGAYALIESSGWMEQFMQMDVVDKTSSVIHQSFNLLGPNVTTLDTTNPIIATFSKISQMIQSVADTRKSVVIDQEQQEKRELILSLLSELDNNPFFHQFTMGSLEESKAINDLMNWFKQIEADDFQFTKKSLEHYVSWVNQQLPPLILAIDKLERQNYLKPGVLSHKLCTAVNDLSTKVNQQLSATSYALNVEIISVNSLQEKRLEQIEKSQLEQIEKIQFIENQIKAMNDFFSILEPYREVSFSAIPEYVRIELRKAYPKIQFALAHANLELENEFTTLLNTTNQVSSWWHSAVKFIGLTFEYDGHDLLGTQLFISQFLQKELESEQLKFMVSERAREELVSASEHTNNSLFDDRVLARVNALKVKANESRVTKDANWSALTLVKASQLNNLRGNLAYLQQLRLSDTVNNTRIYAQTLIHRHLNAQDKALFTTVPYEIKPNEPSLVVEIKRIINSLYSLENLLNAFESQENRGLVGQMYSLMTIASEAYRLQKNIRALSPAAQKILLPVLSQIKGYSTKLFNLNVRSDDFSELQKLKDSAPLAPPSEEQAKQQTEPVVLTVDKSANSWDVHIKQIALARENLLSLFQKTLSPPIALRLKPQEKGVPFIDLDKDPPQIAAYKKIINSLYYLQSALQVVHSIDSMPQANNITEHIAAMHHKAAGLSQLHRAIEAFSSTIPEISTLIKGNEDFIKPIITSINLLIQRSELAKSFSGSNVVNQLGSILGQGLNLMQSEEGNSSLSNSLVSLVTDLPLLMSRLATALDDSLESNENELRIEPYDIGSMVGMAEVFIEKNNDLENYIEIPNAIISLIHLIPKLKKEGNQLTDVSLRAYQQWLERDYRQFILTCDEIEAKNYLYPGILSQAFVIEVDAINRKLNAIIAARPESKLDKIVISYDLKEERLKNFKAMRKKHWLAMFRIEDQKQAAKDFFNLLKKYSDHSLLRSSPQERFLLKQGLAEIQGAMSHVNVDVTNELIRTLNDFENEVSATNKGKKPDIKRLLSMESAVYHYLDQQHKACSFQAEIATEGIGHLKIRLSELNTSKKIEALRRKSVNPAQNILVEPVTLQPIESTALNNVRGNLAFIQELNLSEHIKHLKEQASVSIRTHFSKHVLKYLNPAEHDLPGANEDVPLIPRQIMQIEKGLHHVEKAFSVFEGMGTNESVLSQIKALVIIQQKVSQLQEIISALSPELKRHYGPLVMKLVHLSHSLQSIKYDQENAEQLKDILKKAKKELLKVPHRESLESSPQESNTVMRGVRLGIIYSHQVSPKLEQARSYLNAHFPHVFDEQPSHLRELGRPFLANEMLMDKKAQELVAVLDKGSIMGPERTKTIVKAVRHILRVGEQIGELGTMANKLATDEYIQIKIKAYKEFMIPLSQEEDYLCLQPGSLLTSGMALLNQLLVATALELDMPFAKKLELLQENNFLKQIKEQTESDLKVLIDEQKANPDNPELQLRINIKNDKIVFLDQQIKFFEKQNMLDCKKALLTIQFETSLQRILNNTSLTEPLLSQYGNAFHTFFDKHEAALLKAPDSGKSLNNLLRIIEKTEVNDYLLVEKTCKRLLRFSAGLPQQHSEVKEYIVEITNNLLSKEVSIQDRANQVKALPYNVAFIRQISSVDNGADFLKKLAQFIGRFVKSIVEASLYGENLKDTYYKLKMEQKISNVESSNGFKEQLSNLKEEEKQVIGKNKPGVM